MNEFIYQVITDSNGGEVIKRIDADGNESWIPLDPANSDYSEYLASLEATEPEAE